MRFTAAAPSDGHPQLLALARRGAKPARPPDPSTGPSQRHDACHLAMSPCARRGLLAGERPTRKGLPAPGRPLAAFPPATAPGRPGPACCGSAARLARRWAGVNQSGGQCGRAREAVVAAAGERLAMSIEGWIQRWKVAQVFYDWQTLIAGVLALASGLWHRRGDDDHSPQADRRLARGSRQSHRRDPRADRGHFQANRSDRSFGGSAQSQRSRSHFTSCSKRRWRASSPRRLGPEETYPHYFDADSRLVPRRPCSFASASPRARSRNCAPLASGGAAI